MWLLSSILHTLVAVLLVTCTRALPTSSGLPSADSSEASVPTSKLKTRALDNWYSCFDTKATIYRRAKYNDCARAAAQLPNLIEAKTFHRGGDLATDPYALPKVKIHNSCQIRVDLRFGRSDESSWLGINIAMSKIMAACSSGYGQYEATGGEIVTGSQDFIIISVEKTQPGALELGASQNSTDVATA
ncbi:MAG: hypothetical protein Q9209_005500 [Squamulea sp. 1 TL-2023]